MSVSLIFRIAAVGILITILSQILKHSGREEHAFLISLAGLILVLTWIVPYIYDLFVMIQNLFELEEVRMEVLRIGLLGVAGVMIALQFKSHKPEFGLYIGFAVCLLIFSFAVSGISSIFESMKWNSISGEKRFTSAFC